MRQSGHRTRRHPSAALLVALAALSLFAVNSVAVTLVATPAGAATPAAATSSSRPFGAVEPVDTTSGRAVGTAATPPAFGPSPAHWVDGQRPHLTSGGATGTTSGSGGAASGSAPVTESLASSNWGGWIAGGTTFTGVSGAWTVPSVVPSTPAQYSSEWIGVDGVQSSDLIQTGTSQDTSGGTTSYYAWYEMLPAPAVAIAGTVAPGDQITSAISETSPGVWTIALHDVTQNWSYSNPFSYSVPGSTAEWIEEAPTVSGVQSTLANFGTATFSSLGLSGANLSAVAMSDVVTLNASHRIIAYPSAISGTSFTVTYGTPQPAVTSLTPNTGSTSGGTLVTIRGTGLFGASAVTFGGVGASGQVNNDGSITVTAPPANAGTVAVVVTTPGGSSPSTPADQFTYGAPPAPTPHGYWLVGSDGGIFTFGSAQFYGSTGSLRLQRPVVGIVPTTDRGGYWLDASDGGVFAFGDAGYYGSIPGVGLNPAGSGLANSLDAPIVGMVPSADGGGYFMVASDGGVFAFGDAHFAGSCPGMGGCAGAAVAVMPDATGNGYWLVTQTGHVYTFGDAPYFGAPGPQSVAVTSAVRTPDGQGYWILFANGAIARYGDAGGFGQPAGLFGGLNPATAIFATSDGGGYWVASANGTVDNYGDAPADGSMAGTRLNGSVIAAAGW